MTTLIGSFWLNGPIKSRAILFKIFATQERSMGRDILIWALTCSFVIPSCPIGQYGRVCEWLNHMACILITIHTRPAGHFFCSSIIRSNLVLDLSTLQIYFTFLSGQQFIIISAWEETAALLVHRVYWGIIAGNSRRRKKGHRINIDFPCNWTAKSC